MKRLSAVAVVLLLAASSSFAAWDYFPVIEQGSAEAKVTSGFEFKIRYGVAENLEVFSTNSVGNLGDLGYGIGGRYQVIPEMLSVSLDLGICTWNRDKFWSDEGSFGLVPGVQFSKSFNDMISFGAGAALGLEVDAANGKEKDNGELERGLIMNLSLGAEIDFSLNENVLLWVGVDYSMDRLNYENRDKKDNKYYSETKNDLGPAFGAVFSQGNISVGTYMGLRLDATNMDGKEATGLKGGVDLAIKF